MIEDVKWLKPDDYISKKTDSEGFCWIAKDGSVIRGYFDKDFVGGNFAYINKYNLTVIVEPDGVCDRKPKQKKPVLR